MEIRRVVLGALLAFAGYALWHAWSEDYPKTELHYRSSAPAAQSQKSNGLLPNLSSSAHNQASSVPISEASHKRTISVKTDLLDLKIGLDEGDVTYAALLDYSNAMDDSTPFVLLNDEAGQRYIAKSQLLTQRGGQVQALDISYDASAEAYSLDSQQNELQVVLNGSTQDGVSIQKVFTFKRGSYLIDVTYKIQNQSEALWKGYFNTQLVRTLPKEDKSTPFHIGSYTGASYSNPGHHRYQKLSFKDMLKKPLDVSVDGGWLAMQQHYFLSAWVPPSDVSTKFYSSVSGGDYAIGSVTNPIELKPQEAASSTSGLYLGPEVADTLKAIAPGLDLTIDYGWLWFISSMLFSVMKFIYSFIGNWGWAIVLVTVFIKLMFYRLSAKSYQSMANMRRLQPKLQALRDRYGDDKAKISQATMALYREEKVNPLSGCLPLIIQIPVFIALYWVLVESVELRQAPFVFWIKDLALPDPYHVLPLIMGGTMFVQQKLNPAPPDPMQAKLMMFLPVLFTALFWNFPSGLVLYWTVNNSLTILQQWYITRKIEASSK